MRKFYCISCITPYGEDEFPLMVSEGKTLEDYQNKIDNYLSLTIDTFFDDEWIERDYPERGAMGFFDDCFTEIEEITEEEFIDLMDSHDSWEW